MSRIFSNGKLLLTSEYVVLDGALALALPTKLGQEFFFETLENRSNHVIWEAQHLGQPWLRTVIDYKKWLVLETNLEEPADFVLQILKNCEHLGSDRFVDGASYHLKTNLEFPPDFGLGSSSTLMVNLATWAGVDAFLLNEKSLGGSGYDVAVALEKSPILYQLEKGKRFVEKINFQPLFSDELIFIYLNQKQNSREGILHYRKTPKSKEVIEKFNTITKEVLGCKQIDEFQNLMTEHEAILSSLLSLPTVKERLFPDCPSFVKSLGAWGGDFVLTSKFDGYQTYFQTRGYRQIFFYSGIID